MLKMFSYSWSFWSVAPRCSLWAACGREPLAVSLHNPWILCPEHHSVHCIVFASLHVRSVPSVSSAGFLLHMGRDHSRSFYNQEGIYCFTSLLYGRRYLFYSTVKVIHEQGWNMILIFIQAELKITAIDLLSLSESKGWGETAGLNYGSCFLDWNGIPESEVLQVSTVLMMLQSHVLDLYRSFWSLWSSQTYSTM